MWLEKHIRLIRDLLGLSLGSVIAINETILSPPPNEFALLFALACLAGTFALRQDEKPK